MAYHTVPMVEAYFPPTFASDGFTHATAVPSRLLDVANHFYQAQAAPTGEKLFQTGSRPIWFVVDDDNRGS